MRLHLVGGFLGSGKTTAIIAAAKLLIAEGKKVGVVTNDQGKYLVDTAFFQLGDVPAVGVTGGCFCCNYDDLETQLDYLRTEVHPDVVFAESVGSCGDLVATVIRPMLELQKDRVEPASFSAFTDSRLLLMRLKGEELPFSESVVYIFDQQIEEAGVLIVNKADLLEAGEIVEITRLTQEHYPGKVVRLQNSLELLSIRKWIELIETQRTALTTGAIHMDYQRYGEGEARLAWLDEEILMTVPHDQAKQVVIYLIDALQDGIRREEAPIGHVKFMLRSDGQEVKVSITALDGAGWQQTIPELPGDEVSLLLNARVELPAHRLRQLVETAVELTRIEFKVSISELNVDCFHPGLPTPKYHMGEDGLSRT